MEKILGKREKIFALIGLVIVNVLCVVKFLITFIKECNLINYLSVRLEDYGDINFSNLNYAKVIMVISICFAMLLLLFSFIFLFIKNKTMKRNLLIVSFTIILLVVIFYFNSRFICGDYYTIAMYETENYSMVYLYDYAYEFHKNALFMLASLILSLISCFVNFSLSNDIFDKEVNASKVDSESKEDEQNNQATKEEEILNDEINKLKAKLRIKDLESEYLTLKSKLDKKNKSTE